VVTLSAGHCPHKHPQERNGAGRGTFFAANAAPMVFFCVAMKAPLMNRSFKQLLPVASRQAVCAVDCFGRKPHMQQRAARTDALLPQEHHLDVDTRHVLALQPPSLSSHRLLPQGATHSP